MRARPPAARGVSLASYDVPLPRCAARRIGERPAGGGDAAWPAGAIDSVGRVDEGRLRISSGSPFESRIGFRRAIRVGRRVLVSGTAPVWPDGRCPDDAAVQAVRVLEIIVAALAEAGARPEDVVRTRIHLVHREDWQAVAAAHAAAFGAAPPAATMVVVAGLLDPRWRVEIEAEAELPPA